jgi:hypothetical protein
MSDADDRKKALRETLKKLREERGDRVKTATAASNAVRAERKKVKAAFEQGPLTVPALAAATDLSTDRALWHVAGMRKYGVLVEAEKDGDYFSYALVREDEAEDGGDET